MTALPTSYTTLPFTQIKLSHHPPTSPTPTPIILIMLHRPGKRNAFTPTMMEELVRAFALIDTDDRVRCAVVTGNDNGVFCAGADLEVGFGGGEEGRANDHRDSGGRVALAIHHCRKPIIGALPGAAVGVGITMTLPMSIRVAHRSARIGFVFGRRGLVLEAASSFFLPRLVGHARALHLATTGGVYRADHALLAPLFTELCDRVEEVVPRALALAEEVVANTSVVSTYLMREMMWRDAGSAEAQHLLDSRILHDLFSSSDNKEGVESFLEKRRPRFAGTMEKDAPGVYPWWDPIDTARSKANQNAKAKL